MSLEAYSISVKIALVEGVTRGLALMSRHFKSVDGDAKNLQSRLETIGKMAAVGGGLVGAGFAGLSLLKGPIEEAAKYQTLLERLKQYGLGDVAMNDAQKFVAAQDIMGASQRDMLRYFVEAQGVFRETGAKTVGEQLSAAKMAAPIMAKMNFAMQGLSEEAHRNTEAKQMDMLRFVEQAGGLKSPQRFAELMNAGFKAVQSSGGNVDFTQYRQFMARGGTAAMGLSDRAMFADLEPIIGEMKGSTAGTALMTAFNRLNGIVKLPNQVAHELVNNRLWDNSKIVWNSQGGIKTMTGNPLFDAKLFSQSPVDFYTKDILPMYARQHFDDAQRRRENSLIFGRTGGAEFNLIDKQLPTIMRSREAFKKSQGINSEYEAIGKTYAGRQAALTAKWQTLMLVIGKDGGVLDLATRGLGLLGTGLQKIIGFARQHPMLTKFAVMGTAIVSVLAIVGGALTLITAGFGAVGIALTAIGVPIAGVVAGIAAFAAAVMGLIGLFKGIGAVKSWLGFGATTPAIPGGAVRPGGGAPIQVHTALNLDGKKVASVVTTHQVAGMNRPNGGTTGVDYTRAPTFVSAR